MTKFWKIVGWPFRVFAACAIYVIGNMMNPGDPSVARDVKDVYSGKL